MPVLRDLSAFQDAEFDIVWHPYSINFVPDCRVVFKEAARVLRPGGLYYFMCANPFASGMSTRDWNGEGYVIRQPYIQGAEITYPDEEWVFRDNPEARKEIRWPREYRHTLGDLLNGLVENKLVVIKAQERGSDTLNLNAEPGDWDHFTSFLPPWLCFWVLHRPEIGLKLPFPY